MQSYNGMRKPMIITFFLISFVSNAQPHSTKQDSVYYTNPFFSAYPHIMNHGKKLNKHEVVVLMQKVPGANIYYKKYRNKYKAGLYSYAAVLVFTSIGAIGFDSNNNRITRWSIPFAVGSFISAVIFCSSGEANLRKAIRTYNRTVLY
jgi:hypothetical protein